jgi:hypothetical protein
MMYSFEMAGIHDLNKTSNAKEKSILIYTTSGIFFYEAKCLWKWKIFNYMNLIGRKLVISLRQT